MKSMGAAGGAGDADSFSPGEGDDDGSDDEGPPPLEEA